MPNLNAKGLSDIQRFSDGYVDLEKTFNALPKSTITPTDDAHFVNKKYVDDKRTYSNINHTTITTTTPTTMFPSQFVGRGLTINANEFKIGSSFQINCIGKSTNGANAIGTLTAKLNNTIIHSSSITYPNNRVDYYFFFDLYFKILSIGVNGQIEMFGHSLVQQDASGGHYIYPKMTSSPITIDTTIQQTFDMQYNWNVVGNSMEITTMLVRKY